MRYAYIKYGDVVDELHQIGPLPKVVPLSGPTTFIASFLRMVGHNPALLMSWARSERTRQVRMGSITAISYQRPRGLWKFTAAFKLFIQLLAFRPRIVLCVHDGPGLWAALLACRILNAALLHSRQRAIKVPGDSWRRRASAQIDGFVIRRAVGVICHGPFTRSQLVEIGVQPSRIIEFDVRFEDFLAAAHKNQFDTKAQNDPLGRKIMFLGRVEASKGVFELLDACIPLLQANKDVGLTFVGQGAAMSSLRQRVKSEGLSARIELTGAIAHDQVGIQLRSATVLVTPTRRGLEGWPMAALEGLTMGLPVIAPAAGPFLFMIEDGRNGLHYADGSVSDLRKKIQQILDDQALRQKLSQGAMETSAERARTIKDFGEALSLACNQWGGGH